MVEIKKIQAEETYPIRHHILRPHQPFDACKYETDHLETTFHIGAFIEKKLVSIASFSIEVHPDLPRYRHYRLRAMATLLEYRRKHIGKSIVVSAEAELKRKHMDYLWCKGRTNVKAYYEHIGFKAVGEPFDYPDLGPHVLMVKEL